LRLSFLAKEKLEVREIEPSCQERTRVAVTLIFPLFLPLPDPAEYLNYAIFYLDIKGNVD